MSDKIIRIRLAVDLLGISRSSIYEKLNSSSKYYDPEFPRPIKLGSKAVGFRLSELQQWMESRTRLAW